MTSFIDIDGTEHDEKRLKHAQQIQGTLVKFANALCHQVGLDPHLAVKRGPVKKLSRVYSKATGKSEGIDGVHDLARLRVEIQDNDQVRGIQRAFIAGFITDFVSNWQDKGVDFKSLENKFERPDPKSGLMNLVIKVEISRGKGWPPVPCEIQVVHKDMVETYGQTHALYEQSRGIKDRAAAEHRKLTDPELELIGLHDEIRRKMHMAAAIACKAHLLIDPHYGIDGKNFDSPKGIRSKGRKPIASGPR